MTKFDVDKRDPYENSTYPKDSPLADTNWEHFGYKTGVMAAMGLLSRQIGDAKVLVRQKPRKAVFALCNFAASKLVLVPMTMSVKCVKVGSDEASSGLDCRGEAPAGHVLVLNPMSGSDVTVPAWSLTPVDDRKKANMEIAYRSVSVRVCIGNLSDTDRYEIPVYINTCAVTKGTELRFYREPKPKADKRAFAVIGSDTAKERKRAKVE